mmetsp:Transcript_39316/g.80542  ORF Transcript_39316/g.80542 Transcript_39316/m.80542 type:complete len:322 (+) Transcript_39316:53-1018(+)
MSVPLHYTLFRSESKQAALFLMVHGMTSAGLTFHNVAARIAAQANVHVVCVDLRGHGSSPDAPRIQDYSLTAMALDIADLLGTLKDKEGVYDAAGPFAKVHLLGHSWGSRVVFALAQSRPDLVASLLIEDEYIGPAHRVEGKDEDEGTVVARSQAMLEQYQPHFPSFNEAEAFFMRTTGPGVCDFSRKILEEQGNPGEVDGQGNPIGAKRYRVLFKPHVTHVWDYHCRVATVGDEVWKDCRKFPMPMHVMKAGDAQDSDISASTWEEITAQAKELEAEAEGVVRSTSVVAEAAHPIHRSHPEEFVAQTVGFLQRCSIAAPA